MDLFGGALDEAIPIIKQDGDVRYYGQLLAWDAAERYLMQLQDNIAWAHDEAIIFGKHIVTKRKVAWYGDRQFHYSYSNTKKLALPWTAQLLELKRLVEQTTHDCYNSCLLNLYHDGTEGMGWHSDGETDLAKHGSIASLSFGAARKFCFKHKQSKQQIALMLEPGSLLLMTGATQSNWQHRLPPMQRVQEARINLTFRTIVNQ